MPSNKHFLDNLRKKPESHKNVIAAVFALIPALLVGYAQFYMNANERAAEVASNTISEDSGVEEVSALASMGKIFTESKASIGDALDSFKEIDKKILKEPIVDIAQNTNSTNTSTGTAEMIDDINITKTTE